jgi:hypothetical protein
MIETFILQEYLQNLSIYDDLIKLHCQLKKNILLQVGLIL